MLRLLQAIDLIETSSRETAAVLRSIDEIAFQTNVLALNAAVEAARSTSGMPASAHEHTVLGAAACREVDQMLLQISTGARQLDEAVGMVGVLSGLAGLGGRRASESRGASV